MTKHSTWKDLVLRAGLILSILIVTLAIGMTYNSRPARADASAYGTGAAHSADIAAGMGLLVQDIPNLQVALKQLGSDFWNWMKNLAVLGDILTAIETVIKTLDTWFGKLNDGLKKLGKALNLGQRLQTMTAIKLKQIELDHAARNVRLAALLKRRAELAQPRTEYLCKSILLHQLAPTVDLFWRAGSRLMAEAIEARMRCPTCDGWGPMEAWAQQKARCTSGFGGQVDGYDKSCTDDGSSSSGESRADLDVKASNFNGQTMAMPQFVGKTYNTPQGSLTINAPDPKTKEEWRWVGALSYCVNVAGQRPSPPYGDKLKEKDGMRKMTIFGGLQAAQSGFNKPCTDLAMYYTRPNCTDSPDLCKELNEKCEAARGIVAVDKLFDDCKKGLSLYESQKLAALSCTTDQHFQAQALNGQTQGQMVGNTNNCAIQGLEQANLEASLQGKMVDGIQGQLMLRKEWSSLASMGNDSPRVMSSDVDEEEAAPKRVYQQIKAEKKVLNYTPIIRENPVVKLRRGDPVGADELPLPWVQAQ